MAEVCKCKHPRSQHRSTHGIPYLLDHCSGEKNPLHPAQCLCKQYTEDESKLEEPQDSLAKLERRIGMLESAIQQIDRKLDDALKRQS